LEYFSWIVSEYFSHVYEFDYINSTLSAFHAADDGVEPAESLCQFPLIHVSGFPEFNQKPPEGVVPVGVIICLCARNPHRFSWGVNGGGQGEPHFALRRALRFGSRVAVPAVFNYCCGENALAEPISDDEPMSRITVYFVWRPLF
jgi:hypothetical protein